MHRGSVRASADATHGTIGAAPLEIGERAADRVARCVAAMNDALGDPDVAERVSQAGVLVRLDLADRPVQPVFLCFDRLPPLATTEPQPARPDVTLALTSADLEDALRHGEQLPLRILSGEIRFQGYVRKLLRVLPVLRAEIQARAAATP